jgi:two-component system, cell cycle sensor histidine kinase and response regulator CckA
MLGDPSGTQPSSGLRLIHQAALDGAGLARRLLRVSRGESPEEIDAFEVLDLADVVADAVALTRPHWRDDAARRGVTVDLRVETTRPLPILGVPPDLREIVVNLILNAIDAMPAGGSVLLRGEQQGRQAVLTCQDSGIGMPPTVLARVFEPFFTTKGASGNGMGLAILYGVVARHGGEVRVDSVVGEGTTFTVALPLAEPAPPDEDAAAVLDGLVMLLVDDDPAFRSVFARRLRLDARRVEAVADAGAALAALESDAWDVICLDDRLPDLSGRQLAAEIRTRGLDCAIVLVSGFATGPNDPALLAPGIDGVLPKPYTDAELARVIRLALEKRRAT